MGAGMGPGMGGMGGMPRGPRKAKPIEIPLACTLEELYTVGMGKCCLFIYKSPFRVVSKAR